MAYVFLHVVVWYDQHSFDNYLDFQTEQADEVDLAGAKLGTDAVACLGILCGHYIRCVLRADSEQ